MSVGLDRDKNKWEEKLRSVSVGLIGQLVEHKMIGIRRKRVESVRRTAGGARGCYLQRDQIALDRNPMNYKVQRQTSRGTRSEAHICRWNTTNARSTNSLNIGLQFALNVLFKEANI